MMTATLMLATTYGHALRGSGDASGHIGLVLAGVFMGSISLIGLVKWRAIWRGEYREKFERRYASFGPRWVKAILAIYPFMAVPGLLVGVWVWAIYAEASFTGALSQVAAVLMYALAIAIFICMTLVASIFLINWPKSLIPPHSRDFHGLFGDWIVVRRERSVDGKKGRSREN
jgi:hypothetical protein